MFSYVDFKPRSKMNITKIRDIRSRHIGKLIKSRGRVTYVSDVKSKLKYACFLCDRCSHQEILEITGLYFTPKSKCLKCAENKMHGCLNLFIRGCRLNRYQEIILEELSCETPSGHIPIKIKIQLEEELTRTCYLGAEIILTGIYIHPQIEIYGDKNKKISYIEGNDIIIRKKSYNKLLMNKTLMKNLNNIYTNNSDTLYEKLSKSIAPEIHGLLDIKKTLLLQLISGTSKNLKNGVKIRGDINILLVGDPGLGKSQLLKYVSYISPRAIYTTGKGSSSVGLTAAVLKNRSTGEYFLDAGALVLSDNGICCIDEFDKMNGKDVASLHEVMEQQSISIAKAGITTKLNARVSILAAANPQWSCYNRKKSIAENINMPSALLSRFDLIFILLDKNETQYNLKLAKHIINLHRFNGIKSDATDYLPINFIQGIIGKAKEYTPIIPKKLSPFIIELYSNMRLIQGKDELYGSTPRTLLSLIRLSQSLAKLRFSNVISVGDIKEAKRLMDSCKSSLLDKYDSSKSLKLNISDMVFGVIKDYYITTKKKEFNLSTLCDQFKTRNISNVDVIKSLNEYSKLNILNWNSNKNIITLNI